MRADIAMRMWRRTSKFLDSLTLEKLGSEHTSQGSELTKAIDVLTRAAAALDPMNVADEAPPTEIHIHMDMAPPPELIESRSIHELGPSVDTTFAPPEPTKE